MPTATSTRRTWRADRTARRLTDPAPVGVIAGNCMSVSTGPVHAAAIFRAYLAQAEQRDASVLMLSECGDFNGQHIADDVAPGVWRVIQYGQPGSPQAGALLVVRRADTRVGACGICRGSAATPEGGGIRERSIVTAHLTHHPGTPQSWTEACSAGHAPPERAPKARRVYLRRFARVHGTRGGDMNARARFIARFLHGSTVRAVGIIAVAHPRWVPSGPAVRIPRSALARADHDGCYVQLWPATRR